MKILTKRLPVALSIYMMLAGAPIIVLLTTTAAKMLTGDSDWISLVFLTGRRLNLLLETLVFAVITALSGTLFGLFGAVTLHHTSSRHLKKLVALIIPSIVIPPHVHAMAWSSLVLFINSHLRNMGIPVLPDQGFVISVWVQTMALLPFSFGILMMNLSGIPSDMLEAARIMSTDKRTVMRILVPLASPGISASFAFLFLVSLLDYSVPSLFQMTTYSLGIFSEFSIAYDSAHAFLLSIPILCISLPMAFFLQKALRRLPLTPNRKNKTFCWFPQLPNWMMGLSFIAIVIFLLQCSVPLFVLAIQAVSALSTFVWFTGSLPDMTNTAIIAIGTAFLTLPFAHAAAIAIDEQHRSRHIWWILFMLPFALPAPLVGIALIQSWNGFSFGWTNLYNTLFMPVLACTLRFLPFSVLLLLSFLKRLDKNLLGAACIIQKNRFQTMFAIYLPLMSGAYMGTCVLSGVLSSGELGATLLLAPPGAGTLTLKIYNYLHYGQSDAVSGLCLILYVMALLLGFILQKIAAPNLQEDI